MKNWLSVHWGLQIYHNYAEEIGEAICFLLAREYLSTSPIHRESLLRIVAAWAAQETSGLALIPRKRYYERQ